MVSERIRRILAHTRGFTTTELVVVVAVLGVVTTVGAPTLWTYLRSAALRSGAEEAVTVLNGARQLAIRLNTTVCVTSDGAAVRYHVGTCTAAAWTGPGTGADGAIRLASGLSVAGASHLCFNYLGAGSATPTPCVPNGTLTLTNPTGAGTINLVMATTGRIRIQ